MSDVRITRDFPEGYGDNNARVLNIDGLSPENLAMLQALYARSSAGVEKQLGKLKGVERFHENYVVQYNHKSIADCGSTTFFIENVSILAAKAIQNSPLYNGQETSTRAINMAIQPIVDPFKTSDSKRIIERWMDFYASSEAAVLDEVRRRNPRLPSEDEAKWEASVKARSFDIRRGFLPAGVCTQLSWHTTLRHAGDHIAALSRHATAEVRALAKAMRDVAGDNYPSSGFGVETAGLSGVALTEGAEARAAWLDAWSEDHAFPAAMSSPLLVNGPRFYTNIDPSYVKDYYGKMLRTRPRGAVLPHFMTDLGLITFQANIDYGSWRDLQRHRNGVCRVPHVGSSGAFERWYLKSLPESLVGVADDLISDQFATTRRIDGAPAEKQYLYPLGTLVAGDVTYGLPAAVYVMEIRASKVVHPTMRAFIHKMIKAFEGSPLGPVVPLHVDMTDAEEAWTIKRGSQTIVEKALKPE